MPARRAQELVETEGSWENLGASFHFDVNGHLSEPVVPGLRPKRRGGVCVGGWSTIICLFYKFHCDYGGLQVRGWLGK